MTPIAWLAVAGTVLGAAAGFSSGWTARGWKEDSARLAEQEKLVQSQQAIVRWIDRTSEAYLVGKAAAEVREVEVVKEVTRVVSKPVYLERCLDDDGLRIVAADIAAANARRGFAPAVPASAAAR